MTSPKSSSSVVRLAGLAERRADAARAALMEQRRACALAEAEVRRATDALERFRADRVRAEADLRARQLGRVQAVGELSRFIGRLEALRKEDASLQAAVATAREQAEAAEAAVEAARRAMVVREREQRKWDALCQSVGTAAARQRERRAEEEIDEAAVLQRAASVVPDR